MDFNLSEENEQLRDAIRKWVDRDYSFARHRAIVQEGGFSRKAYSELVELGVAGLYVPETLGGLGMGPIEGMVVMEELGRGLVLEPFAHTLMSGVLLGQSPHAHVKAAWCEKMVAGEALIVLAYQERQSRYRPDVCITEAYETATGWEITGVKSIVAAGDMVDAYVVPAVVQGNLALFVVDRKAAGVTTRGYLTQDGSRAAELVLEKVSANMLNEHGKDSLEYALDVGVAALCAQAVGMMEATLALTVDYMKTRKQFGVAIASFQALRHRVADMKMQLELARSMSYYASLKLNASREERRLAISRAKVQLGESMRFVGQQAIQLHGGIGMTDEYMISHYFKSLTQMEMTFGDTLHHLQEVSTLMRDTAGVF